jgi:putative membrane protein
MKRVSYLLVPLVGWLAPAAVLPQERFYEWHWEMHPMWWSWGLAMMAMMFLFWALVIIGLIVGIRWLLGKGREEKSDAALQILRERYARGEINKEEFEARKRDLVA